MSENITPTQRAANFKAATRQNLQSMPAMKMVEGGQFDVTLPKARFLSRIFLKCDIAYTATLDATKKAAMLEKIHGVLKNITLNMNTGFKPFVINGEALAVYNKLYDNGGIAAYTSVENAKATVCYELPVTLTPSDPVGLLLLQNTESAVNLSAEMESFATLFSGIATFTGVSMNVTPMLETFTIPSAKEAYPSLSILKLVNSRQEVLVPSSENIIRMSTGTIYRKIIIQTFNQNGAAADLDDNAIISIVFNQADTPYNITAGLLKMWNFRAYGKQLPTGVYVFDFSTADIPEHNGSRDLVDTERLTEFWIKVNTNATVARAVVTTECLTRVQ